MNIRKLDNGRFVCPTCALSWSGVEMARGCCEEKVTPEDYYDVVPDARPEAPVRAVDRQEGGNHYKDCAIQPIQYIFANELGFAEGNVIKYVSRWKAKNGVEDLRKARHYLDLLIEQVEATDRA